MSQAMGVTSQLPRVRPGGFPADPDFPQLAVASDPERMLELFRRHLEPAAEKPYHIETCVPLRFRCRQSTARCVLQYTLRLLEPSTGRRWDQGVTGLLYAQKGMAERLWREMQATDPSQGIPDDWLTFRPVGFIPDLEMVVQVFPYDRKLRNLGLVLGGALRDLDPQLLARLAPGEWHVTERTMAPTRYRTELGAALKYTLQARDATTGRAATLRCFVKVYRNDHGEHTFELLQSLGQRVERGETGYSVVRPVAYRKDLRTLVLEEAPGTALLQLLREGHDPAGPLRITARAVAAFHQDDVGTAAVARSSLAVQLEELRRGATIVEWARPELATQVRAITAAVATGLEEVAPAPIHGDLKPDHVFLAGDRVIFIDLDSVVLGDPVRDAAHMFAYVAGRVGLDAMAVEQARAAAGLFAAEYFDHVPEAWRRRFGLHCAGALVEVASAIFRRQEAHWPEKVAAAVAAAQDCLRVRA